MREELGRFDSSDRVFDQVAELAPLLVRDRGTKVLDLNQPFADEYDLSDFGDAGDPGVANQLWIKS
jgi:hypothetical protein